MIGVVDKVRQTVASSKEALLRMIAEIQKPILDQRVDEMLKEAGRVQKVTVAYVGRGFSLGRRFGSLAGAGRSLIKKKLKLLKL